ncbi:hypothetical protein K437DRAFT_274750 [Tilletiaria anomala UBC 951]|uniref:S-adenosyl-L-methionine-dependent methyltransferase n=1 Tax=Tilletiaria anomala (strain ATCC 24038 / CBS 436.72 / UBC 951) TaxID=1037660 RepID=A0A066VYM1_TILAU|nr:uncharacterized protein K437DRAFT_274750 [Tilletiaria anomala UBC 951]KDN43894.1 hypothetical protein K437DRAFT_274750 [Tilletiaria anomala UBC 951]
MVSRQPHDDEGAFIPSRDLPSLRTPLLSTGDALRALNALRRGYGLPARSSPADRGRESGTTHHVGPPVYVEGGDEEHQRESEEGEGVHDVPTLAGGDAVGDEFEERTARAWLQRLISGKVTLVNDVGQRNDGKHGMESGQGGTLKDEMMDTDLALDDAAVLLSMTAGKSASGPSTLTYRFHSFHKSLSTRPAGAAPPPEAEVKVTLRDQTLVADALGGRTWGAAPLLAWELLAATTRRAPGGEKAGQSPLAPQPTAAPRRILELGAGTGLAGLALASFLEQQHSARVAKEDAANEQVMPPPYELVLTDHHPNVLANLRQNVELWMKEQQQQQQQPSRSRVAGRIDCCELDWYEVYRASLPTEGAPGTDAHGAAYTSRDSTAQTLPAAAVLATDRAHAHEEEEAEGEGEHGAAPTLTGTFDTLIVADCIYDTAHPVWIRAVAARHLAKPKLASAHGEQHGGDERTSAGAGPGVASTLPLMHVLSPLRQTHAGEIDKLHEVFPPAGVHSSSGGKEKDWQLRTLSQCVMVGYDDFAGVRWRSSRFAPRRPAEEEGGEGRAGTRTEYVYMQIGWVLV